MRTSKLLPVLALAIAGAASLAPLASATQPYPIAQSLPTRVLLVGTNAGVHDPLGTFQVVVKLSTGGPLAGAIVTASIAHSPGVDLCTVQPNPYVDCTGTAALSNVNGIATLTVLGRADHGEAGSQEPSMRIFADGIYLGTVRVAALDHDGGGLGPSDVGLWLDDYFTNLYIERSDLDGDGGLGPGDLSAMLTAYFADGSLQNCATACP